MVRVFVSACAVAGCREVLRHVRQGSVKANRRLGVRLVPLLLERLLNSHIAKAVTAAVAPHEDPVRRHQAHDGGNGPNHANGVDLTTTNPARKSHGASGPILNMTPPSERCCLAYFLASAAVQPLSRTSSTPRVMCAFPEVWEFLVSSRRHSGRTRQGQ
ncbi:uncharacterized protein Tco025E_07680 [Trypanosoma conorhini]|uniref:Uncharacterized protein n=1 Tax=Trypanosoma conorhini TaxID=83891 RepID=A0A422NKR8_9TRYP|nr:uncharacterized protein Tco025E_07680 [Trypanosoma conorhini]RNF06014.1 hypothetical protein Tco025E_07680 [Trypanosoma conorhini]